MISSVYIERIQPHKNTLPSSSTALKRLIRLLETRKLSHNGANKDMENGCT